MDVEAVGKFLPESECQCGLVLKSALLSWTSADLAYQSLCKNGESLFSGFLIFIPRSHTPSVRVRISTVLLGNKLVPFLYTLFWFTSSEEERWGRRKTAPFYKHCGRTYLCKIVEGTVEMVLVALDIPKFCFMFSSLFLSLLPSLFILYLSFPQFPIFCSFRCSLIPFFSNFHPHSPLSRPLLVVLPVFLISVHRLLQQSISIYCALCAIGSPLNFHFITFFVYSKQFRCYFFFMFECSCE